MSINHLDDSLLLRSREQDEENDDSYVIDEKMNNHMK